MGKYGIYNNHVEFYDNLLLNHRVKYNISDTEIVTGTVKALTSLGVKAVVIETADKKKYAIFPRNSNKLEIAD
tara:strand:- start:1203 stop:1421 length:219 start_codon:yes stop_codon:yes gene_type:complete